MHARMPRIIGGEELFVHTSAFRELDEFLMQEQEVGVQPGIAALHCTALHCTALQRNVLG